MHTVAHLIAAEVIAVSQALGYELEPFLGLSAELWLLRLTKY